MNLDSIILHISLLSWFCVILKFDKPAFYVFIQIADINLGHRRSDSESGGMTLDSVPQQRLRCTAITSILWIRYLSSI